MPNQRSPVFLQILILAALMQSSIHCNPTSSKLNEILTHIRARLDLALDVAFVKLKTCKPIEDSTREREILANATSKATKNGLTNEQVETFYKAQMEANKMIQFNAVALSTTLKDSSINIKLIWIRNQLNELDAKILPLIKPSVAELKSSKSLEVCLEAVAKVVQCDPKTADYYKVALVRAVALFTETCLTAPTCKSQ